jgi:hypothetical protein
MIATRAYCCRLAREDETSAVYDPITSDWNLEKSILLIPMGVLQHRGSRDCFAQPARSSSS